MPPSLLAIHRRNAACPGGCRSVGVRLPNAIAALTNLQLLDLSGNFLAGPLPKFISSLSSLQILDLSSNSFDSQIPSSWSALGQLQNLSLAYNGLTGAIPADWRAMGVPQSYADFRGNCRLCGNTTLRCSANYNGTGVGVSAPGCAALGPALPE